MAQSLQLCGRNEMPQAAVGRMDRLSRRRLLSCAIARDDDAMSQTRDWRCPSSSNFDYC